jgi:hypothetical protein
MDVWRGSLQALLVGVVCGGALGLLPGRVAGNPGRCSLRLPPSLCELRRTGCWPRATLCRPFRAQEGPGRKAANARNDDWYCRASQTFIYRRDCFCRWEVHDRIAQIGGGAAGKGRRCESAARDGTKDSRDAHSASLPALDGAVPQGWQGAAVSELSRRRHPKEPPFVRSIDRSAEPTYFERG